ncbi:hypothetical protein ATCC90586_006383 [Pythium insidiosum]|nr:hypothetical protein ATCC90586_006383 [Pythium insidiosum]
MMATSKYKYMPLSEANVRPVMVAAYDGQRIHVGAAAPGGAEPKTEVRYSMGNYLGGGIAGVVYEAFDRQHQRHVAIKTLNPIGYKLCSPSALRRGELIKRGLPFATGSESLSREHVFWVKLPMKRELVACYLDARHAVMDGAVPLTALRELTLDMCVALWSLDADEEDGPEDVVLPLSPPLAMPVPLHRAICREEMKLSGSGSCSAGSPCGPAGTNSSDMARASSYDDEDEDMMMTMMMQGRHELARREEEVKVGDIVYKIPPFPAKYKAFLQSRRTIYREIAHMHKLTGNSISGHAIGGGHPNVLKLYDVLEYVQPSKSTIFLVLELAAGGELFDRIRGETGVDETLARNYFSQLLSGVLFCHSLGIVHRDLKPENLLLSDSDVLKIADFGLSAHFIAAVSSGGAAALSDEAANDGFRSGQPELDDDDDTQIVMPVTRFRRLNSVVGSPHYVAPEILQNSRYGYDGRKADMWSIGVILYSLLAGSLPFGKDLQTCPRYLNIRRRCGYHRH